MKFTLVDVQQTNGRRLNGQKEEPLKDHCNDFSLLR
jgi:hypothetical protein